jgi:hypothetical protein
MAKIGALFEQIQKKKNQAIANAKVNHATPDQLITAARESEKIGKPTSNGPNDALKIHDTDPLESSEFNPISKQLVSNKEAISKQLVSSKETASNLTVRFHSTILDSTKRSAANEEKPNGNQNAETEKVQNSKQLVSDKEAISKQLVSDKGAISKQLEGNKEAISKQLVSDKGAIKEAISKQLISPIIGIKLLSPLQQNFLIFLFEETKKSRSRFTDPISAGTLANNLSTTKDTIKDIISKLKKRLIFDRVVAKRGAGGWTAFELSNTIYRELLDLEKAGNLPSISKQLVSDKGANKEATLSSSSSDLNMSKTTTAPEPKHSDKQELPPDWQSLDYSGLAKIGFKECHIRQIFESGKSSPEMVQESIHELEHDLQSGTHGMKSPLLVILKQLRGKGEPYTAITPGYVSDQLRYEQKQLEELKRRHQELIRIKEEQARLRDLPSELEKESKFQTWLATLGPEQRRQIAPMAKNDGSEMQRGLLRAHWEKNIQTTN